ncbi:hypothetical protein Leryth_002754 [Lithospermum erythrorhizon]|nr:hypothetical protein Leryth_002754 [Lithospermum erythrorhizon]
MKQRQSFFSPDAVSIASMSSSSVLTCCKNVLNFQVHYSPAVAFSIANSFNKCSVIPVLDDIVWSIMNFNLYGVSTIVYQENYGILVAPDHCRHILCCYLPTTLSISASFLQT